MSRVTGLRLHNGQAVERREVPQLAVGEFREFVLGAVESGARLTAFFGESGYREFALPNVQHFDWDGLLGRAMSASYVPALGSAGLPFRPFPPEK